MDFETLYNIGDLPSRDTSNKYDKTNSDLVFKDISIDPVEYDKLKKHYDLQVGNTFIDDEGFKFKLHSIDLANDIVEIETEGLSSTQLSFDYLEMNYDTNRYFVGKSISNQNDFNAAITEKLKKNNFLKHKTSTMDKTITKNNEVSFENFKAGDRIKIAVKDENGKVKLAKAKIESVTTDAIQLTNTYVLNNSFNDRKEKDQTLTLKEAKDNEFYIQLDKYPNQKFDYSELKFPLLGKSAEDLGNKNIAKLLNGEDSELIEGLQKKNKETNAMDTLEPAKLSLKRYESGAIGLNIMEKAEKLVIGKDDSGLIMGVQLNNEDREKLNTIGHAGLKEGFKAKDGSEFSAYVSLDKEINQLKFMPKEAIKLNDSLKGTALSEKQKNSLLEGKPTLVKKMKSQEGKDFSAYVVIDANKKNLTFHSDKDKDMKKFASKEIKEVKSKTKGKGVAR